MTEYSEVINIGSSTMMTIRYLVGGIINALYFIGVCILIHSSGLLRDLVITIREGK